VFASMRDAAAARPAVAARKPAPAPAVERSAPRAKPAAAPRPRAKPAPAPRPRAAAAPAAKRTTAAVADEPDSVDPDMGVLMVGAKPPCRIYVDGRDTRLTTPQRSIVLSPGKHEVTLVNREFNINQRFTVGIGAGKTTRLIKDMSKQLAGD
jgi:hypothetical protein